MAETLYFYHMSIRSTWIRLLVLFAVSAGAFLAGRWTITTRHAPIRDGSKNTTESTGGSKKQTALQKFARAEDTAAWRTAVARSTGSMAADDERERLLEQWAEVAPREALDFARSQLKGDRQAQAISAAISVWGKNDPEAAWKWVETEMPEATHHFDNLLEVFGKKSNELAVRFAGQYASAHPDAATEVNLAALLGISYRGDFDGARALIQANAGGNAEVRGVLNNFVAGQWARYAPTKALEWVMTLPSGAERDQAVVGLGESWSESDPAGAAAFAATLPEGESRSLAMRQAISKWVEAEPLVARKWVIQTDARQDFDSAVEAIATQNNFMYREPAKAMAWATGIFGDALRAKTMGVVLHNWYAQNPAAATAYLNSSSEFTPEKRAELLKQLSTNQ